MRSLFLLAFLFVTSVFFAGSCGWIRNPAPGKSKYIMPELRSMERVDLDRAYKAAKIALGDFNYVITVDEKNVVAARLVGHGTGDEKVTIMLAWESKDFTKVTIRVGSFGAKEFSKSILEKMRKNY